jgi:two-component system, sensor histidine kinase
LAVTRKREGVFAAHLMLIPSVHVIQRVLVADDDPQLLDTVCEVFTRLDADVVRGSSGGDLIEQVATAGSFDLVITDISMPWMSGLQAIRSTRAAGLAHGWF